MEGEKVERGTRKRWKGGRERGRKVESWKGGKVKVEGCARLEALALPPEGGCGG